MTPDSPESRIGRLERDTARLEQRVDDLATTVRTLAPLVVTVTKLESVVDNLSDDVHTVRDSVLDVKHAIDEDRKQRVIADQERDKQASAERQSLRTALIGLTGAIVASMITALTALLVAGVL